MRPGRFLTACMLYLGALAFAQAILGYVLEPEPSSTWTFVAFLIGVGPAVVGIQRLRNPDQEERPQEYGWWVYPLVLFLAGFTAWLAYTVSVSVGASA